MNNNPLLKTAMQYGAYSGLSNFAFFLLLYFVTSNPLGNIGWLGFWIPILFIVIGTKFHRNNDLEGYMKYWRGVNIGSLIALCASLIYAILVFAFVTLADPEILANYKNEALAGMDEARKYLSNDSILSAMDEAEKKIEEMTVSEIAQSVFFNGIIGGFIVSLIVAAIFRKDKPLFDNISEGTAS